MVALQKGIPIVQTCRAEKPSSPIIAPIIECPVFLALLALSLIIFIMQVKLRANTKEKDMPSIK